MENEITLSNENGSWQTLPTKKWSMRKQYERTNEKEIRATLPGTIVKLLVKEGQEVKSGTPLMELEAMKMVSTIGATRAGKIGKISVKEGQEVSKSELLISFD